MKYRFEPILDKSEPYDWLEIGCPTEIIPDVEAAFLVRDLRTWFLKWVFK